ncbi:stage VI sporulation protein D [Oceanobacillus zhaokaii]|uniref:stage VI sporulation protein D n=1 Tax=Oceanobacillus zhaokaii TaxID=2052660 RepID=UPI0013B3A287|nr:stage VI sporulation protein D [Oceanobacillus zhaokaii]
MTTDSSVFTFELNESLFFEKGQEVAELRGIALDPEISIQAYSEYISIKGVIELRGEYIKVVSGDEEQVDSLLNFDDLHVKRYIEKVINVDDDIAEFTHRFPIEISVPTYRVADLNDVTVSIEAFDYEIPEESQLKLYSTIAIHGINREADHPQLIEEEVESEEADTEQSERDTEETFQFEIKEKQELETIEEEVEPGEVDAAQLEREPEDIFEFEIKEKQELETIEEEVKPEEVDAAQLEREPEDIFEFEIKEKQELETLGDDSSQEQSPILTDSQDTEEDEAGRVKTKSQSFADFFGKKDKVQEEIAEEIDDDIDDDVDDDDWYEDEVVEVKDEDREVEDVSYLSDVFRNSEEDKFIKMRLCIVQKEDTIDTIAERFHVSAIQLIKQNQLDDDFDVSEGQLLYIPAEKK